MQEEKRLNGRSLPITRFSSRMFLPRHLFLRVFLAALAMALISGCEQKKQAPATAHPRAD